MTKPVTHVAIVLDRSGSMASTKQQAIQGYNEQVQQMKLHSKTQDIFCSFVSFNGQVFDHHWDAPANSLHELSESGYCPDGSTALRDAIGYTVKKLLECKDATLDNVAFLVVVVSDGEENSSQHISPGELRELIDSTQKTGRWTYTYMGCSESGMRTLAIDTNIPISNMAVWSNATPQLATAGFMRSTERLDHYYAARASNDVVAACLYSDDKNAVANWQNPDSITPGKKVASGGSGKAPDAI